MIDLDALIKAAETLQPLPDSVTRLARLVAEENADLSSIVRVVELDPALTGRLLKSANSARSAPVSPITTVRAAVTRLGSGGVLSLAMASSVQSQLKGGIPGYGLSEGDLWRHSMSTALAAESWTRHSRVSIPPEAFTAALLHDIGKLILGRFLAPQVRAVLDEAMHDGQLPPLRAETEVLGVHHAELGGLIAQHWALPQSIVAGITCHHDPDELGDTKWAGDNSLQALCDIVHVSDFTSHSIMKDMPPPDLENAAVKRLGVSASALTTIVDEAKKNIGTVLTSYA